MVTKYLMEKKEKRFGKEGGEENGKGGAANWKFF